MNKFTITNLQDSSILALYDMKSTIQIDPVYQRPGGVWSLIKRQLFIDSLLNRYDIPKFYLHHLTGANKIEGREYSIIDGRQRLEAIWHFMDGGFPLSDDFVFLEDPSIQASGLTYKELVRDHPRLATRFHSRSLTVMVVTADELDFIEDMFSRLNEAVPLNAAEKRNALGGPLPIIIRDLVRHSFFKDRIAIAETRYRHHDIAAKLLYLESQDEIVDTKRASLDYFIKSNKLKSQKNFINIKNAVSKNLDAMSNVFVQKDHLLISPGTIPVYYTLFSRLHRDKVSLIIKRRNLEKFEDLRASNRQLFAEEKEGVNFKLIEYDELARSSNDGSAIRLRYEMLRDFLRGK